MSTSHHSVANFMNCQVGRLLTRRASENTQYLSELAKRAAQLKLQRYSELLLQCGCTKCQATHEWDRNRQAILGLHYSKKSREAAIVGQVGNAASRSSLLLVHLVSTGIITREYRDI